MSYPSGIPSGASPEPPEAGSPAYPPGSPYPQPNVLGDHPVPGQKRNRNVLLAILIVVVMAVAGLTVFWRILSGADAGGLGWVIFFAFFPVPFIVLLYLLLDRYEPEPAKYIMFAFAWGAFIATLMALWINTEAGRLLGESAAGGSRAAVFVAPPVEEFAKGAVILLLALIRRKEFDGILDGLVYAGMVGIGFAFTENILYYSRIYTQLADEGGSDAGFQGALFLFFLRGLLSPFAHPLFTSFTAIGIGIAVRHRNTAVRYLAPIVGYLAAVFAHALWNGVASWAGAAGFFGTYLVLMLPIFVGLVIFALVMRARESQMIASRLYDYVRFGWLTAPEVPLIATLRGRKALRQNAKRYGAGAASAAKAFQHNATELAYLRDKIVRQVIGPEALPVEKKLLDELRARRPSVPFPPMPVFRLAQPANGLPPGQPGYPPGPAGHQGPPGGYGPYPPSQFPPSQ